MRSISSQMDGPTIVAEVRMQRQTHKGAFLLVEGWTDVKRFERVVDQTCAFVNCFGKVNVLYAIDSLYDDGFEGALGLVDADFDRLLGTLPVHEGIVVSETHDFDLDTITTTIFERYVSEVADTKKIAALGGARKFLLAILNSIKPLAAMKFTNVKHRLGYSMSDIDLEQFFNGRKIDLTKMIDRCSQGKLSGQVARETLEANIRRYLGSGIDIYQIVSGHDFCAALGIALRNVAGTRKHPQTWRSEIELHIRLAFDFDHFREMQAFPQISKWEAENVPRRIVRQ
ncbi:MAG: hypothetical protein ACRED9_00900 [Caulobacteraceae bacterium]